MNTELKKLFAETAQKTIARECTAHCFPNDPSESCFSSCYAFSLNSFNITARTLRELGHLQHSKLIHLAYGPSVQEWRRITDFNDSPPDLMGHPKYYFEQSPSDNNT